MRRRRLPGAISAAALAGTLQLDDAQRDYLHALLGQPLVQGAPASGISPAGVLGQRRCTRGIQTGFNQTEHVLHALPKHCVMCSSCEQVVIYPQDLLQTRHVAHSLPL